MCGASGNISGRPHDIQNIYEMRENLFCAAAFAVNEDVSAVQPERNRRRHKRNTTRRKRCCAAVIQRAYECTKLRKAELVCLFSRTNVYNNNA